jgi:sulfite reductase beta subunit-like hemoprotein
MVDIAIDDRPLIDPDITDDIAKFEDQLVRYRSGDLAEDAFRVFRLNNGIYGQRQGGDNQMVRVKIPAGIVTAAQLDRLAEISERYSRGWGHITTRQNIQFHYVQLDSVPDVMRDLAEVDLTTREACGDTVRNVQGCHLAGACPHEVLDITPWAWATYRHFLRNPHAQRMPRKFKINFSGCATDCGQAMFNDVGVIAATRTLDDGTVEAGFRVFIAGGLGATPHPALALEDFTPREELLPTIEACLRVFDHNGNRENKLRARMKWLVDLLGFEELQRQIFKERHLLVASATWPGGIPAEVLEAGDAPAGRHGTTEATPVGSGTPVTLVRRGDYERWEDANVVRGIAKGAVSAYAWARLGDITAAQFRSLASIQRELGADVRVTNRQNLVFRDLREDQLRTLFDRLSVIGMAEPGAELARDVVACPGADTCNLAVTQSRGLADEIGSALEAAGLADVGGVRTNISGCTNSCGQHHASDIGFFGAERRAHGQSAPGYQMLLGGHVGDASIQFGQKALRLPARNAPTAAVRVVGRFASEREAGEAFQDWLARAGGASEVARGLEDLDEFPSPDIAPEYYTDFGETGPYEALVGDSECAT